MMYITDPISSLISSLRRQKAYTVIIILSVQNGSPTRGGAIEHFEIEQKTFVFKKGNMCTKKRTIFFWFQIRRQKWEKIRKKSYYKIFLAS